MDLINVKFWKFICNLIWQQIQKYCYLLKSKTFFILQKNNPVPYYLLVTTGQVNAGDTQYTEVINIFPYDSQAPIYQNVSKPLHSATGGWVGNLFIVCGGQVYEEGYSQGLENHFKLEFL